MKTEFEEATERERRDFKLQLKCLTLTVPAGVRRDYAIQAGLQRCINEKTNIVLVMDNEKINMDYNTIFSMHVPNDLDIKGLTGEAL
jgi:hypothetical protein